MQNMSSLIQDIVNHIFSAYVYDGKVLYPYSTDMIIEFFISDKIFCVIYLKGKSNDVDKRYGCIHGIVINDTEIKWLHNWDDNVFELKNSRMIKLETPSELTGIYNGRMSEEQYKISKILCEINKLYFTVVLQNFS